MPGRSKPNLSEVKDFTISRENVHKALMPELELIGSITLRDRVVDAWRLACSMGGYKRVEDCPTEEFEGLPTVSNIDHQRGTARIASFLVRGLKEMGVKLNEDYVVAAALCHDVGKPLEWQNGQRGFYSNAKGAGTFYGENSNMPRLDKEASFQIARHSVLGVHIAMTVGMPDHVVHMIAAHSLEGNLYFRSPEALIVKEADEIWWEQVAYSIQGKWPDVENPLKSGKILKYRKLDWQQGSREE